MSKQTIDQVNVKKIIADYFHKPVSKIKNHTLSVLEKNGTIKLFGDRILLGKTEGIYIALCTEAQGIFDTNSEKKVWWYNFEKLIIFYIPSNTIVNLYSNISILHNTRYSIDISKWTQKTEPKTNSSTNTDTDVDVDTDTDELFVIDNNENSTTSKRSHNHLFSKLTKREYAAIHLKVPMSGEKWLDDMINVARKANVLLLDITKVLND